MQGASNAELGFSPEQHQRAQVPLPAASIAEPEVM
jgi:hypothetical protein